MIRSFGAAETIDESRAVYQRFGSLDYGTMPPKVDYRLTELGMTVADALSVVDQWVVKHYHEMAGARENYLRRERRARRSRLNHNLTFIYAAVFRLQMFNRWVDDD